jgi:C-terminal processing protease CtpA/Prc
MRALTLALLLASAAGCSPPRGTIGALLAKTPDGRVHVRLAPTDLAAGQAGIQAGDELLLVNGQSARDITKEMLHALLSGEVGEPVRLTLIRDQEVLRVTLRRSPARSSGPHAR